MSTLPPEPDGTFSERAADDEEYLGRDAGAGGAADPTAAGAAGSGAGGDDPTTEADEDTRFA